MGGDSILELIKYVAFECGKLISDEDAESMLDDYYEKDYKN